MKNSESLELSRYIFSFLDQYAPQQKTSSPHTLKSYRVALSSYVMFLEDVKGVNWMTLDHNCFEPIIIEEWLNWQASSRGCKPETCNVRLSAIRVFLKYLSTRDIKYLYLYTGSTAIPMRKCVKKKVCGLSRDAVKTLFAMPDQSTKSGKRDLALMIILYATAARIDEMLSMKIGQLHLDADRPYITIIGKGRKIRTIYILPMAVTYLQLYINFFHGDDPDPEAYVFYSRNTGKYGKLTQPAVAKMLRKHAASAHEYCADVPLNLHAHQFRHAKASHWLEDGMNIVQISFLLGHEQLQTTMKYLDITTEAELTALATLDEEKTSTHKKWKASEKNLREYCGLI